MNRSLIFAALLAATSLAGPALAKDKSPELSNRTKELMVGEAPEAIVTPVANGYTCMAAYTSKLAYHPVFSVGKITDQTGKFSNEASAGGFEVTQGLSNEVYSALGELPGIQVAERSDMGIVDNDLTLWKRGLIGDAQESNGLRDYKAGQMLGVDYYVTGAITSVNYNIYSGGIQGAVSNIGPGHRVYAMQIEMDLRVVDARTLRVVRMVKERKTIRGYETTFGLFSFLGGLDLFDINAGKKAQEPVGLGVRLTMETALLRLVGATIPSQDGVNYGETCAKYAEATYGDVHVAPTPAPTVVGKVAVPNLAVAAK